MSPTALPDRRRRGTAALAATVLATGTLLAAGPLLAGAASADATTATGTVTSGIDPSTYSCGGTFSYGFEDRYDFENISGTTSGPLRFSTTSGNPWSVLSDSLNSPYSIQGTTVGYDSSADGRIDFTDGPVSSFSALVANYNGSPTLKAYDANGALLATAGPAATTVDFSLPRDQQKVDKLAVADTSADIAYVVFGGVGGYYVEDNLCVNGEGPTTQSQSITFDSSAPTDAVVGSTYQVSATGGASGNPVTFSIPAASADVCGVDSAGLVTFTGAGTCTVDADQAGADGFSAAPTASQGISVGKGSQTVAFTSTRPAHAVVGATYQVSATGGASGNPVTYSVAPASAKVCTVDASGTVTFRRAGTCTVNADQAGNDDYTAAPTATQNISVSTQKANQAITFTSTAPAPGVVGGTYQATAQGGGSSSPVVFSAKSTSAKVCTVAPDGSVAFLKPGNCVVYATQAGDASYRPAPRVQQTVKVVR